ncbi:MAG: CRISPR-associated helicase Cas3' [Verrucomicrobiota bacterium]|nr:CRISPR-associated helicase Cas3' [Verrucomicrobiota bacterium]
MLHTFFVNYYAHTVENQEHQTLYRFRQYPLELLTAAEFRLREHRHHNRADLCAAQPEWQPLSVHLENVANLAARFAAPFNASEEARLAGLLHDLGKYADQFQARLANSNLVKGINHWSAGAAVAGNELNQIASAFVVDGHHTGLPACNGDGLKQTIARMRDPKARESHTKCTESLKELLDRLNADGLILHNSTPSSKLNRTDESLFAEAFRIRMLFSCLVDADCLDTEAHFDPAAARQRTYPVLSEDRALQLLLDRLNRFPSDGTLNHFRRQLLEDCLNAATKPHGLFTLTAPTGSGKTLASLAFALKHAVSINQGLAPDSPARIRRIIVVIPYTSIIEQTADVYRKCFESTFGSDYVLEHHSATAPRPQPDAIQQDAEDKRMRRAEIAQQNWASPIVVTTSVQFFESLFSNRTSPCRKLHNLAGSVLLFDEVQTLPITLVPSLLSAVTLLTRDYGASAVFMTATQPAFTTAAHVLPYGWKPIEIASQPDAIAQALRRTRILLPPKDVSTSWEDLAQAIASERQALCVVNTTDEAAALYRKVKAISPDGVFHLSTRLCPQHRREKLAAIRARLISGESCRLVSTQLIEAGVDVDFPIVWRAFGPLDSIIQTAGRCNREGRSTEPRPVHVFRIPGMKTPPGAYATASKTTEAFLNRYPDVMERLHRPEFYAEYFRELYAILGPNSLKQDKVFTNSKQFDFPAAAEACKLVDNNTSSVLVRWGHGADLAVKLAREKHLTADERRMAHRFAVNFYQHKFQEALKNGWLSKPAEDWDFWIWDSHYDDALGICHAEGMDLIL